MDRELVSVVVPVYNIEQYVGECLTSLVAQDYVDIEIIVVDDGSTDRSGEICDEFAEKDTRIVVYHKENGGLSDARNYGLSKAKGAWVIFVDGDDYVRKRFVSDLYLASKDNDADIVVCGYNDVVPLNKKMSGVDATCRLLTRQENIDIVAWNKIYRKKMFRNIKYPVGEKYEDALTTYKLYSSAKTVVMISKSLYTYRTRADSIMGSGKTIERLRARERAAKEAKSYLTGRLREAAQVSELLAWYAYVDFAEAGRIEKKYGDAYAKKIRENASKYKKNEFMNRKLKIYNVLISIGGGWPYKLFRKIRHE